MSKKMWHETFVHEQHLAETFHKISLCFYQ